MTTDEDARRIALRERLMSAGCDVPEKGSATEHEATRAWNGALDPKPALVARCATTVQLGEALRAARDAGLAVQSTMAGRTGPAARSVTIASSSISRAWPHSLLTLSDARRRSAGA